MRYKTSLQTAKRMVSLVLALVLTTTNVLPVLAKGKENGLGFDTTEETITDCTESTANSDSEDLATTTPTVEIEVNKGSASDDKEPSVSESIAHEDLSENCILSKTERVELSAEAEGIFVTLSGQLSSFEEGKEYSLSASRVEVPDNVEEAISQIAANKNMVITNYQALDIKLFADGVETQPLGPVEVCFSGDGVLETVKDKDTQVRILHVDDEGTAVDMEAAETESGVSIETSHFSVYVVVDMNQLGGNINVEVQHWTNLTELTDVDGSDGLVESATYDGTAFNATASLKTKTTLREIYSADSLSIDNNIKKAVSELSKICLSNSNKEVKNYELSEIWFLKDGCSSDSTVESDWDIYSVDDEAQVTLTDDTVIRLIYDPVSTNNALFQDVTFFDYNVTDGEVASGNQVNTANQGINSASNFTAGGDTTNRVAVGMYEVGVRHNYDGATSANGNYLNKGNGSYIEGMVTGVTTADVIYNGIYDAGLFNREEKIGKKIFDNFDLVFNQLGDTYTLAQVYKDGSPVMSGLDVFQEVYDNGKRHIFSNNFFPMDYCDNYSGRDPFFGDQNNLYYNHLGASLSTSDDFQAHNWFFGMRYDFEFVIGDYTGPLYYYFRGDDDFWLFVDGDLVTDMGGIHSAVGMTANLEYLKEQDRDKNHKVTIIYAERGGFGSSCYMQFTLPNVSPVIFDTSVEKTSVIATKIWDDGESPYRPSFAKLQLMYKENGEGEYSAYNEPVTVTAPSWEYTWAGLPKDGYTYKVIEVNVHAGYTPSNVEEGVGQMSDGVYSVEITNVLTESTEVNLQKIWDDAENLVYSRPENIAFQLLYRVVGESEWIPYPGDKGVLIFDGTVDDLEISPWAGIFDSLPVYDPAGEAIEYTIRELADGTYLEDETVWNGQNGWQYTTSYVESRDQDNAYSFSVTNKLIRAKLSITKRVNEVDPTRGNMDFWFLITGEDGYKKEIKITFDSDDSSFIGFAAEGKSIMVDGLKPGTYTVQELPVRGYDLVEISMEDVNVSEENAEKIPFATELICQITTDETEQAFFWNRIKEAPSYSIKNEIRFDESGNIHLSNTKQEN